MSRCTRAKASPKSFESVNARPPVSAASDVSVSCDAASRANCCATPRPEKSAAAAPAGLAGIAAGDDRLQAAGVDRIDRHVGADRRVDRRAQLDLVVLAAALHAGAEIEDRLLLLDRRQRLGQRLQRAQPDVVVEHVELGGVVRRGRVVGGGRLRRSRRSRRSAAGSPCRRCSRARASAARDLRPVGGEVGEHVERRADGRHGDQVGGAHLSRRRTSSAESTARCTSSGCIELMSKSRTIRRRPASVLGGHRRRRRRRRPAPRPARRPRRVASSAAAPRRRPADPPARRRVGAVGDLLEGEAADRLRLAVLA